MIVKVCGITTIEDALMAIEAGADMLGFNFYPPSPRYITPDSCAAIIANIHERGKSVTNVGVFVNASVEEIQTTLNECKLNLAQLHGDEGEDMLVALGKRAFKAVRPKDASAAQQAVDNLICREQPPYLLLDAHHKNLYGGTGETGNWALANDVVAQVPILLAGGLNPDNVTEAIQKVQPWGVDVASGVESSPGSKDHAKTTAFIAAAKKEFMQG